MKKIFWLLSLFFTSPAFSQSTIFDAARYNDTTAIQSYIAGKFSIDTIDAKGYTPLILACYNENTEAAALLLEAGADPNIPDKSGNSALMGVAFKGYIHIVQLLIEHKVAVDQQNYNGATALIFAATFGHKDIVHLLLQQNADLDLKDRHGNTALSHATMQENEAIIGMLKHAAVEPPH